jgi:release factor glutamine methyltransferase
MPDAGACKMTTPCRFDGGKWDAKSALRWAAETLEAAGVASPRLTAELLLAHALDCTRLRLLTHGEMPIPAAAARGFEEMVSRRTSGEPLQYITGVQEFYGRSFRVGPAVLIPRPETEILIEKVVALAHSEVRPEPRIVDVGTGSGCIAVSVAAELPGARVWGTDISTAALAVARENAVRHQADRRMSFICADLLECFSDEPVFDFIVSNPPYVALTDGPALDRTVREHEPHGALFGGVKGMDVYRSLIPQAARRLNRRGRLVIELGAGMRGEVAALVERANLVLEDVLDDLQGIPRCIVARRSDG